MLTKRSDEKELLDLGDKYFTQDEYRDCLKKLFRINQLLGFFQSTVKTIKSLPNASTLLDVGCGGGLFLLHLSKIFPHIKMLGTDISTDAISDAEKSRQIWQKKDPRINVSFHLQEKSEMNFDTNRFDIILATLVCHHLNNDELIQFLKQTYYAAKTAVIINDLHRNRLAHLLYGLISPILFRNRLITHDGLISIRRSFIRQEWEFLLKQADIQHYQLKWCFPFRWQLILWK